MSETTVQLENRPGEPGIRRQIHEIIFGHHTPAGLAFDLFLLLAILVSVVIVCLESVAEFGGFRQLFLICEVAFTILFACEYGIRVWCVRKPYRYIFSFFGIVDLLSVLPSLVAISLFLTGMSTSEQIMSGTGSYAVIRSLRLLRVFRLLRIGKLERESGELAEAIWNARSKVIVFLLTVLITVVIAGTLLYEIEKFQEGESQFESIPEGIYWAIVTMTTVGYGDIVPTTVTGRFVSSVLILIGYSLIIVPTGFVSAEVIGRKNLAKERATLCEKCRLKGHDLDAVYCRACGAFLPREQAAGES